MAPTVVLILALLLSLSTLTAAKDNVALNGTVTATTGWSSPSLANDGIVGASSVNNCYHSTDVAQVLPGWWRVVLGAVYPLDDVTIHFFNNGDGLDRSSGMAVYVQNNTGPKELCTTIMESFQQSKTVSCPQTGQILELRKTDTASIQALALCEVQIFVTVPDCASNSYRTGEVCTACGHCLTETVCDKTSGACPAGCEPGWTGTRCDTECSNDCQPRTCTQFIGDCTGGCVSGRWGPKCDKQCSANCAQMRCDQSSAACTEGCKDGWKGSTCNEMCEAGRFGAGCTGVCGHCPCHHVNGSCTGACDSGWKGSLCNQTCQPGQYGAGCRETCGQCLQGTCHHVTGNCTGECQPGWREPRCDQVCGKETYGSNCAFSCGECLQQPCHHVNGSCLSGCLSGKTGDLCKEVCPGGTYGIGCANKCGLCVGVACLDNGNCPGPCQDGWRGTACNQTCSAGRYGTNCSNTCGSCRDNAACNHSTGNCPGGCETGWDGLRCLQECNNGTYGEGCTKTCGQCAGGVVCDKKNGACSACEGGFTPPLCLPEPAPDNGAIIGGAVGGSLAFILVLVIVVLAVCLVRRKRQQKGPDEVRERSQRLTKRKKSLSTVEDVSGYYNVALEETLASSKKPAVRARKSKGQDEGGDVSGDIEASPYYNLRAAPGDSSKAGIPVASFPDYVKSMKAEMKFQPEYESVPSDFLKPYEVSQMKEHAGKNKFKTYYPYDDNRVVLEPVAGDPNSHYINASHVDGFDSPKAFIAAQAPTKVTLPDFLRMIWQQHCSHVVMLANLWEEGRAKCERYFPEKVGEDLKAGEITVTLAQETTYSYCIVRLMTFSHKNGESRTIRQFHFTTWPDHGVPSHVDMLDFFWKVRASWTPASGPLLVHCSAGVGRTGTFIALCLLSDQAASQHRVDPLATLTALRHQRRNMIQTLEQYEFLHEVLERVLVFGKTAVSKTVFADHYKRLKGNTFMGIKTLDQIKEALPSLCVARKVETFQAFDESNVYSNTWNFQDAALHLSSVRLSSGCVQVRLCEAGQEDVAPKGLWSFLSRVSSSVLVDVHSAQKACVRQPGEAGEMEDGSLTVQWQAPAALASGVTLRSVLVKDEDKETQVTYLSYNWRKAEASRGLVPAVSHLCNLQLSASPSPITFIYRNADDEQTANMLCASLNVAETILMDSEVELVNNILRVKASFSPEMVVQCAEFAKAFMQVTDVYANA